MPAGSLLALLDDISTVLDDVAVLTKLAAKKTAGVLGDDLALNAEQVSGVRAQRELPVVWAVARGSLVNKAILVPAALGISALLPWAVVPLLMLGGGFLCFEGAEKLAHKLFDHAAAEEKMALRVALTDPAADLVALEKEKIRGAVRTDLVLSAEIVTIALGTVAAESLTTRLAVLTAISVMMTVGVYGLVAAIVKLDDLGLYLTRERESSTRAGRLRGGIGRIILSSAPYLMKTLSVVGTAAMFLVGGGILTHGVGVLGLAAHELEEHAHAIPGVGVVLGALVPTVMNGLSGLSFGAAAVALVRAIRSALRWLRGGG